MIVQWLFCLSLRWRPACRCHTVGAGCLKQVLKQRSLLSRSLESALVFSPGYTLTEVLRFPGKQAALAFGMEEQGPVNQI